MRIWPPAKFERTAESRNYPNFSVNQSGHEIATLFYVMDSWRRIPDTDQPIQLSCAWHSQLLNKLIWWEFLARSAMRSDIFILFIIISMEELVGYSTSFLTISLLISFPLHDAQEFFQMRKLRIWGMSDEKMDGMAAVRWTSARICCRKRSRYFVRRFGFKPNLRRLLSL